MGVATEGAMVGEATSDVIEAEQLRSLAEAAGVETVLPILDAFWASNDELLAALDAALGTDDADAVAKTGHALKGSASNLGATALAQIAKAVEMAGKAGDVRAARDAAARLPGEIEETKAAFGSLMDSIAA